MSIPIDVVKQYSPAVYFHENEQYFPCSIEYLLQNSVLKDRNQPDWQSPAPTQATLQQQAAANYYVAINPSQFGGDLANAPQYYAVQEYEDAVQISYVTLYAYQAGQTCRFLRLGTEFDSIIKTLGIHQGDLERVIVTLIPQGEGTYQIQNVVYEAHGNLAYYSPQQVSWVDTTHPIVNVALNGHSSWNMLISGDQVTEFEQPGSVAVTCDLSDKGPVWKPYTSSEFKQLGLDAGGNPIGDQVWAVFKGRLGDSQDNGLESATYLDGSNLSGWDWDFVVLTGWFANLFGLLPDNLKHGNGPTGPGDRDWVHPVSGDLPRNPLPVSTAT